MRLGLAGPFQRQKIRQNSPAWRADGHQLFHDPVRRFRPADHRAVPLEEAKSHPHPTASLYTFIQSCSFRYFLPARPFNAIEISKINTHVPLFLSLSLVTLYIPSLALVEIALPVPAATDATLRSVDVIPDKTGPSSRFVAADGNKSAGYKTQDSLFYTSLETAIKKEKT